LPEPAVASLSGKDKLTLFPFAMIGITVGAFIGAWLIVRFVAGAGREQTDVDGPRSSEISPAKSQPSAIYQTS